jgi:hypothetical protein
LGSWRKQDGKSKGNFCLLAELGVYVAEPMVMEGTVAGGYDHRIGYWEALGALVKRF